MAQNHANSFLDEIRRNEGDERLRSVFAGICEKEKTRAAILLGDPQLSFPCLYILAPQIRSYGLERRLTPRTAAAMKVLGATENPKEQRDDALFWRGNAARSALKWVLDTGREEDGLSEEYEEILEIAASVLIGTYHDMTVLPGVVDMIFSRGRAGHNIHNLVWAAFQTRSPQALKLFAQRMVSSDERDARLACSLLGIDIPEGNIPDIQKRQEHYLQWLKENDPFLYFTDESLQFSSRPAFYSVDMERKYIHRGTPSYDRQPVAPADESERESLAVFKTLGDEEKRLLADYSHQIHDKNPSEWKAWVRRPVDEQIRAAKLDGEKLHDHGIRLFV
jgi:hypothetical protein